MVANTLHSSLGVQDCNPVFIVLLVLEISVINSVWVMVNSLCPSLVGRFLWILRLLEYLQKNQKISKHFS